MLLGHYSMHMLMLVQSVLCNIGSPVIQRAVSQSETYSIDSRNYTLFVYNCNDSLGPVAYLDLYSYDLESHLWSASLGCVIGDCILTDNGEVAAISYNYPYRENRLDYNPTTQETQISVIALDMTGNIRKVATKSHRVGRVHLIHGTDDPVPGNAIDPYIIREAGSGLYIIEFLIDMINDNNMFTLQTSYNYSRKWTYDICTGQFK